MVVGPDSVEYHTCAAIGSASLRAYHEYFQEVGLVVEEASSHSSAVVVVQAQALEVEAEETSYEAVG